MTKKKPQTYFTADWHLDHYTSWLDDKGEVCGRGIINFERTQFKTIQEHDKVIFDMVDNWCETWAQNSTLWILGDVGDTVEAITLIDKLVSAGMIVNMIMGNHDKHDDFVTFSTAVNGQCYKYPVYLSDKLVVSHEPVAVWGDTINVHGHLHGSVIDASNYVNASLHVADYKPISLQYVNNRFADLSKYNRRFLYEPWAEQYRFTQPREDVIMNKDGVIDLSASRVLQRLNSEKRKRENNSYQPYNGTFN